MDVVDFFVDLYGVLKKNNVIVNRVLSPLRRLVRGVSNKILPTYLSQTNNRIGYEQVEEIIVSFTSFPARIGNVWQVVECMKRQTIRPSKIILWLSSQQFPNEDSIPQSLKDREDDIFVIRLVDGDIRSHKKYYYVSKEYSDSLVFLIDDDIYYPSYILEKSVEIYKNTPKSVICNYGCQIRFDSRGYHFPYSQWLDSDSQEDVFFGSGGGTLFRPSDMYTDLTKKDLALKLAPNADDIWLNAMARIEGLKIVRISNRLILPIYNKEDVTLDSLNNGNSQNDIQIKAVEDYYGACFNKCYKK